MPAVNLDTKNTPVNNNSDNQNNQDNNKNIMTAFKAAINEIKEQYDNFKSNINNGDEKIQPTGNNNNKLMLASAPNQSQENITPTSITNFDGTPATQRSDGSVIKNNEDGTQTLINGDLSTTYPLGYDIPPVVSNKQTRGADDDDEKPSLTTDQAIDKIVGESRWNKDVVTYQLNDNMSDFEKQQARKAFEEWNKVTGVEIKEATNDGNVDISFGYGETGPYSGGWAYNKLNFSNKTGLTIDGYLSINKSTIVISDRYREELAEDGKPGYFLYLHEIGHSLGLEHPGNYNAGKGKDINYTDNAEYVEDTRRYSVMSYFNSKSDNSDTNFMGGLSSTPMLHDVAAVQKMYGKNETTNNWNNTYVFNGEYVPPETLEFPDLNTVHENGDYKKYVEIFEKHVEIAVKQAGEGSITGKYREAFIQELKETFPYLEFETITYSGYLAPNKSDIKTLYDTGGIDTIDTAGYSANYDQTISLVERTYSSIGGMTNNVSIAQGVIIENVITGDGNDTITGNSKNNRIETGGGNDIVNSGLGNDTIIDGGGDDEYTLDNLRETRQLMPKGFVDDNIRFSHSPFTTQENDKIFNFSKYDKITIDAKGAALNVTYTYENGDTLIDYGSGTIRVVGKRINSRSVEIINQTLEVTPRPRRPGLA